MGEHARILESRYKQLLYFVRELDAAANQLYAQGHMTLVEREEERKRATRAEKEAYLCSCLTGKGASRLVDISQVLKNEQVRQNAVDVAAPGVVLPVAAEVGIMADVMAGLGGEFPRKAHEVGRHVQEDVPLAADGLSREKENIASSSGTGRNPPIFSDKPHLVEDTYSVLFFTFMTQILHHLNNNNSSGGGAPTLPSSPDDATHTTTPLPNWLHVDLIVDSTRDYFSSRALKDVVPSERNPAAIKLSLLLESFQQLYHAFKSFKSKNLSLHEKLLEAVKTKERLESELKRHKAKRFHDAQQPVFKLDSRMSSDDRMIELEAGKMGVEGLKRSYARSEQRCKQLVVVTQQWALECEDKVKLINLQEQEIKGLKAEVEQLEKRVTKYKKFWVEYRSDVGAEDGKVSDLQFEELRNELAMRRELYNMVLAERDQAQKEVAALFAELEALKDHNVQLADRAANYQVQAKAKEPAVREMSSLLDQNKKLRAELDHVAMEKIQLQERVRALESQVESIRNCSSAVKLHPPSSPSHDPKRQRHQYHQQQHQHQQQQPPLCSHDNTKSFLYQNHPQLTEDDTFSLSSSEGDSGSFYTSSHGSTTTTGISGLTSSTTTGTHAVATTTSSRARPGSAPPPGLRPPSQLGSRDASMVPFGGPGQDESGEAMSEASFEEGMDYTRAIRYPNHSKIHVAPLLDEDRLVLRSESQRMTNGLSVMEPHGLCVMEPVRRSSSRERLSGQRYSRAESSRERSPAYFEQNGYGSQGINPPPSMVLSDRMCPACNLVFHSLSDAEFDGHRMSCRGKAISI